MLEGFKKFILRGNVVDLAVGVVIGAAFGAVVTAFTKDLLTPLINAAVSFLLVAGAVYFFVVTPLNALMARIDPPKPAAAPSTRPCPQCLSEIPIAAKRCAHCTQLV